MVKPAYSVSFLLSINIFVWQNVLYFLDAPRIYSGEVGCCCMGCVNLTSDDGILYAQTVFKIRFVIGARLFQESSLGTEVIFVRLEI